MNLLSIKTLKVLARAILATFEIVKSIHRELCKMTAQTDQLTAAVTDLSDKVMTLNSAVVEHDNEVKKEIQELADAVAASGAKDDPAVAAAIEKVLAASTAIAATSATVAQETSALAASVGVTTTDPVDPATPVSDPAAPTG